MRIEFALTGRAPVALHRDVKCVEEPQAEHAIYMNFFSSSYVLAG
jgi:hypothetical protein